MKKMSGTEELKNMIYSFRVSELQDLLGFAGRNKTGKKQELQARALDLLKLRSAPVQMKVIELHKRRFHVMNMVPPLQSERALPSKVPPVQNSVDAFRGLSRGNVLPSSSGYGASMSYTSSQMKPMALISPTASTSRPAGYPIHPDVKLKDLPFYDVLGVLLQPSSLSPSGNGSYQENHFQFHLSPQQVHDIVVSRDYSSLTNTSDYNVQIQLRFCLLETSCEQDDNFPPSICVKVNNKLCQLPNPIPTNRPGVEPKRPSRPVNITSLCKLSATTTNNIIVSWASEYGRAYAVAVYLVRRLDSSILLSRLRSKGMRNPDHTRAMIKEKLEQSPDSEIATTSLRGSLTCPIGKMKMQIPCRPITCTHLQCFDANLFLKMNEKKPRWICPVCDKPATFKSLAIDGLFSEISAKAPSQCTEVQFHEDGSWTPIMNEKEAHDVDTSFLERNTVSKPSKKRQETEVVDLTVDSDSDDEWSSSSSLAQQPTNTFKASGSGNASVELGVPSSVMYPQPKIPTTAPFISLPSPSSPSVISSYDGMSSSTAPSGGNGGKSASSSSVYSLPHTLMKPTVPGKAGLASDVRPSSSVSRDPVFGNSMYSNIPFIDPSPPYYASVSTPPPHDELASSSQAYNVEGDFDLFSLLQVPDSEQQVNIPNSSVRKPSSSTPDIISLD